MLAWSSAGRLASRSAGRFSPERVDAPRPAMHTHGASFASLRWQSQPSQSFLPLRRLLSFHCEDSRASRTRLRASALWQLVTAPSMMLSGFSSTIFEALVSSHWKRPLSSTYPTTIAGCPLRSSRARRPWISITLPTWNRFAMEAHCTRTLAGDYTVATPELEGKYITQPRRGCKKYFTGISQQSYGGFFSQKYTSIHNPLAYDIPDLSTRHTKKIHRRVMHRLKNRQNLGSRLGSEFNAIEFV